MKECSACGRCFPDDLNHCPDDAVVLSHSLRGDLVLDERYTLERRLGRGGMGIVFKASHVFLRSTHAIKVILPDLAGGDPMLLTRFRQEAVIAASIRHKNIVLVTDFGVAEGTMPFLVMELLVGKSLWDILAERGRLSSQASLEMMEAITAGVGAAHRRGIVHRDLKPLNIFIQDAMPISEGLKILDFGLAKIKSAELFGSLIQAQTTSLMGSPLYMAPEQWSEGEPDARADIYSIGIMLYQMLSGDTPFSGSSLPKIMKGHLMTQPPSFASLGVKVSRRVERVVRHALEKDPQDRPSSVDELLTELREAVSKETSDPTLLLMPILPSAELETAALPRVGRDAGREQFSPAIGRESLSLDDQALLESQHQIEDDTDRLMRELEDAQRRAEEARRRVEEAARKRVDKEAERKRAEEEATRKRAEEEEARKRAEEEEKKRAAAGQARKLAEEESARLLAAEDAQRKADEEHARKLAGEEANRLSLELADARRRAEEARKRAEEEAQGRVKEEAARIDAEERAARLALEVEEIQQRAEEARTRAEEDEANRLSQEVTEAGRRAEEARTRAEEQAQERAKEEAARRDAEERADRLAREVEEIQQRAEEARKRAEEEERRRAEEQAERRLEEEAAARIRAEEEARRRQEEEAVRQRAKEEAARLAEEVRAAQARVEEARKLAEVEAHRRIEEEGARKRAEEEASRLAREVDQAKHRAEEVQKLAEQEARRRATEEFERKLKDEQEKFAALNAAQKGDDEITGLSPGQPVVITSRPQRSAAKWVLSVLVFTLLIFGSYKVFRSMRPAQTQPLRPDLVSIPGGTFTMGRDDGLPNEAPAHPVTVNAFSIDRTEVTNAEYADFVREASYSAPSHWSGTKPPAGNEKWPVVNVSLDDARAFAAWRSKRDGIVYRLPTEEEWEYAARGVNSYLYPWGNTWVDKYANVNSGLPEPVGSYPKGASPWGVLDMVGNVMEWTSSKASIYPGNPKNFEIRAEHATEFVVRGSSYTALKESDMTTTLRQSLPVWKKTAYIGLRLVRSGS